jgi:Vacuolar sorting-associated protein 13, extended-chorein
MTSALRWTFAFRAILSDIRERRKRWTWRYMSATRQDRKLYVELFTKKAQTSLSVVGLLVYASYSCCESSCVFASSA